MIPGVKRLQTSELPLSEADLQYLQPLLRDDQPLTLEDVWSLMDAAWDECECDPDVMDERISRFYAHPVWLLNGLFIEQHDVKSVVLSDRIIGCPHEEGIDYPQGEACPRCPFWAIRDRWTGEVLH